MNQPTTAPHSAGATPPDDGSARDYARVAEAIRFLDEHHRQQPDLDAVASHVGLSSFHFQRMFKRWAGVTPKRFLQFVTVQHAKSLLAEPLPLLEASWEAGLSGPSRLHDLMVQTTAITPGEQRAGGSGLSIAHGFTDTPFGIAQAGVTDRGLCTLSFHEAADADAEAELMERWPRATYHRDDEVVARMLGGVFQRDTPGDITLDLRGTNFQIQVWQALLQIPVGEAVTYQEIARRAGRPGSARAAANAVGANPVAYLIPCHRVIRSTGAFGGYRWGVTRKRVLLAWEATADEAGAAAS